MNASDLGDVFDRDGALGGFRRIRGGRDGRLRYNHGWRRHGQLGKRWQGTWQADYAVVFDGIAPKGENQKISHVRVVLCFHGYFCAKTKNQMPPALCTLTRYKSCGLSQYLPGVICKNLILSALSPAFPQKLSPPRKNFPCSNRVLCPKNPPPASLVARTTAEVVECPNLFPNSITPLLGDFAALFTFRLGHQKTHLRIQLVELMLRQINISQWFLRK